MVCGWNSVSSIAILQTLLCFSAAGLFSLYMLICLLSPWSAQRFLIHLEALWATDAYGSTILLWSCQLQISLLFVISAENVNAWVKAKLPNQFKLLFNSLYTDRDTDRIKCELNVHSISYYCEIYLVYAAYPLHGFFLLLWFSYQKCGCDIWLLLVLCKRCTENSSEV